MNGECVAMTQDHTATREDEKVRCRAAGGTVDRKGKPHLYVKLIGLTPPLIDFD